MNKNPSPYKIVFWSSICTGIITVSILASIDIFLGNEISWATTLSIAVLISFFSFFSFSYFIKRYIYREINRIYKILQTKNIQRNDTKFAVNMDKNIISDVEKEVSKWIDEHKKDIDKYKTLSEYRRKFVGDISHELKTPIFAIQSYLHTLLDGALFDKEKNVHFLKKAIKNTERLDTIVQDLESISRLESGEYILETETFDIRPLIEDIFDELEIKASAKKIQLKFSPTASNYKVIGDKEKIRQVLSNLILNSIKYGKKNGKTIVEFQKIDSKLLIKITDNGIGIPNNHLSHVFDRFYRIDKSRSREQGGSGLGLSIVKHIIEAHKQSINVKSTVNQGSTFSFTLDIA